MTNSSSYLCPNTSLKTPFPRDLPRLKRLWIASSLRRVTQASRRRLSSSSRSMRGVTTRISHCNKIPVNKMIRNPTTRTQGDFTQNQIRIRMLRPGHRNPLREGLHLKWSPWRDSQWITCSLPWERTAQITRSSSRKRTTTIISRSLTLSTKDLGRSPLKTCCRMGNQNTQKGTR